MSGISKGEWHTRVAKQCAKRGNTKALIAAMLAMVMSKALAAPVTISFSEFPPGTNISSQYWDVGAVFVESNNFPLPCYITHPYQDESYAFASPPGLRCNHPLTPDIDARIVVRFMDTQVPGYLSIDNRSLAKGISLFVSSNAGATVTFSDTADRALQSISVKAGLQQVTPRKEAHKIAISGPSGSKFALDTLRFELIKQDPDVDPDKHAGDGSDDDPKDDFLEDEPQDELADEVPDIRGGACLTGNPCDPATGNKLQVETDYKAAKVGPSFTRYYNSTLRQDVGLGFGWTSSVHSKLEFDESSIVFRRADGRGERFTCPRSGICSGDPDSAVVLRKDANGYTVQRTRGVIDGFDTAGRLTSKTYPSGARQTLTYDPQGRIASVAGPFGHTLSFAYNGQGRLSTVTYPDGLTTSYGYDGIGNLVQVNYPDQTFKRYHYESSSYYPHHLTGITNENGVRYATFAYSNTYTSIGHAVSTEHAQTDNGAPQERFTFSYPSSTVSYVQDAVGSQQQLDFAINLGFKNLVKKTGPDGKFMTQTFDGNNNVLSRTDEEGRTTTFSYNATNQLVSMTEGAGTTASRTTTYQYLSATVDLPTQIRQPSVNPGAQQSTTATYNNQNNPTLVTRNGYTPAGAAVSRSVAFTYNAAGRVTSIDGPRTDVSDVTTFAYYDCTTGGACGQLSALTNALGHTTHFGSYDAAGRLLQQTDPNGLRTAYRYDLRGRLIEVTETPVTGSVRVTTYTYTPAGDVRTVTLPDGRGLTYDYDAARMLRRVTDNQGNYASYRYDLKGNRTQEYTYDATNTLVRQIDTAYDVRNRVSAINAAGSLTQQVHDALGNLVQSIDPNNNPATTHSYDALNRLLQTVNSIGGATNQSYDVNDRPTQIRAPNGATTQYQYDDLGNLLSETSPDRGTTTYAYDAAGNRISMTDARGITTTYSYDALNRVISADYPGSAEDAAFAYDTCAAGTGRLCQVTDASGTTAYSYDAFGNVTQVVHTELGIGYTTQYAYDAGNRVSAITYPDGRSVTYTRDALGRISAVNATVSGVPTAISTNRSYRADGLLTAQTFGNGLAEGRQYDLQGRLTRQTIGTADTRLYDYDLNGNLTRKQSLPEGASYGYDPLDRLTSTLSNYAGSGSYAYDANGNRLSDARGTYSYLSATNRLSTAPEASITLDAAGNLVSDGTRSFTYNADGHLATASGAAYVYNHRRLRTRKTIGSIVTVYHYDPAGHLLLETNEQGQARRAYVWADDVALAQIDITPSGEQRTYLHTDHLGTPRLASDSLQRVVWRIEGEAFSATAPNQDPDGDGILATINLRFPGQYYDAETGLHYNWNRYYDPRTGRYVMSDPVGLEGGLNTYAYVLSNPINFTDPLGLYTAVIYVDGAIPHSAMYIGGDGRTPFLYDPAGSYQPTGGDPRGSGDFFEGDAANMSDYVNYHTGNGDTVRIYPIPTTPDQERDIIERAIEIGGAAPFTCGASVSGALGGVCGVQPSAWPGQLYDNAANARCR